MGRSHVKVFVRTRPTARPYEGFKVQKDSITINFRKEDSSGPINNQLESLTFKFDGILENASQDDVYSVVAADAVDAALSGINATIFAYGQTGAGKTFTMAGDARNYHHRGIIPRALHNVFREIDMRPDKIYRVSVSYLEIHNEALYDLLSEAPGASSDALAVMDDAGAAWGVSNVRGLTQVPVATEEEALAQFFAGEAARSTSRHVLNANSSRSHALFGVAVEVRTSEDAAERAVVSRLTLVDLAGSERTKKTNATGEALREAVCINKSLTFLQQVVNALARGDAHVPFRQSKLTAALKESLGGSCRTVMVANLWPEAAHVEECASTLRFASRVRTLVTNEAVNESADPGLLLRRYERQIKELKQELAMRDMLSGRGYVGYEDPSEAEQRELRDLVAAYFVGQATLEQLPINSLKRIRETYRAMKAVATSGGALGSAPSTAAAVLQRLSGQGGDGAAEEPGQVGDLDPSTQQRGFALGAAPLHARPPPPSPGHAGAASWAAEGWAAAAATAGRAGSGALTRAPTGPGGAATGPLSKLAPGTKSLLAQSGELPPGALVAAGAGSEGVGAGSSDDAGGKQSPAPPPVDLNALFLKWKGAAGEGRRLSAAVREQQQQLRELRQQLKEAAARVNAAKAAVDEALRLAVDAAAADQSGGGGDGAVGTEEQLRAAKASYRSELDQLKSLRSAAGPATGALAEAKRAQLEAFEAWCVLRGVAPAAPGGTGRWGNREGGEKREEEEEEEEELDPAETFERLQMARIIAADPDSGAFHTAARRTAGAGGVAAAGAKGKVKAAGVVR